MLLNTGFMVEVLCLGLLRRNTMILLAMGLCVKLDYHLLFVFISDYISYSVCL